jgi:tellurite resistance protein
MNSQQADEYLKALVSAYVWVASADGGVDVVEWIKYEHVIMQSQFVTQFDPVDIRHYFKDMVAVFSDNYENGVALTQMRLKQLRGKEHLTHEVVRLCRAALIGDGQIKESEKIVFKEIAKELDLTIEI